MCIEMNFLLESLIFRDEFIADGRTIRSVLDYNINITKLTPRDQYYVALTGKKIIIVLFMIMTFVHILKKAI